MRIVQNPSKTMVEAIDKHGRYHTYNQEPKQLTQALTKVTALGGPLGTAMLPFVRTPVNALKYDLERSPLGLVSVAQGALDKTVTSGEMADKAARTLIGSGIAFSLYKYAEAGNITGPMPSTQTERDAWKAEGKMPYSIKIGGSWWDLRLLAGLGASVALAGGLAETKRKVDEGDLSWQQGAGRYALHMVNALAQRPLLDNLAGLMEAIGSPDQAESWWDRASASAVSMYQPVAPLGRYIRGFTDPMQRDPEGIGQRLAANYPGTDIPVKRTVFGEELRRTQTGIEAALNPFRRSQDRPGIRRYAGSLNSGMDTRIAAAIAAVKAKEPGLTAAQKDLYNRFNGRERTEWTALRARERTREKQVAVAAR